MRKFAKKMSNKFCANRIYLSFSSLTEKHDFSGEIVFDFIIKYENVSHNNNAFVCSNVRAGASSQRGFILFYFFADLGFIYLNHRQFIYRNVHLYFFNIKKILFIVLVIIITNKCAHNFLWNEANVDNLIKLILNFCLNFLGMFKLIPVLPHFRFVDRGFVFSYITHEVDLRLHGSRDGADVGVLWQGQAAFSAWAAVSDGIRCRQEY